MREVKRRKKRVEGYRNETKRNEGKAREKKDIEAVEPRCQYRLWRGTKTCQRETETVIILFIIIVIIIKLDPPSFLSVDPSWDLELLRLGPNG